LLGLACRHRGFRARLDLASLGKIDRRVKDHLIIRLPNPDSSGEVVMPKSLKLLPSLRLLCIVPIVGAAGLIAAGPAAAAP
jgi:hypothetical protein